MLPNSRSVDPGAYPETVVVPPLSLANSGANSTNSDVGNNVDLDMSGNNNHKGFCSQCPQSCPENGGRKSPFTDSNNNNNSSSNNNNGGYSVPPIQVTAKVLFGSVSAISALNAERKKKT